MSKHTPSPWKKTEYVDSNGEHHIGVATDYPESLCNGARSIAYMTGRYLTRPTQPEPERSKTIAENRANAHLMAAVPELIEIVEYLAEYVKAGEPCVYFESIGIRPENQDGESGHDITLGELILKAAAKAKGETACTTTF